MLLALFLWFILYGTEGKLVNASKTCRLLNRSSGVERSLKAHRV
jgi:hypothetical protein